MECKCIKMHCIHHSIHLLLCPSWSQQNFNFSFFTFSFFILFYLIIYFSGKVYNLPLKLCILSKNGLQCPLHNVFCWQPYRMMPNSTGKSSRGVRASLVKMQGKWQMLHKKCHCRKWAHYTQGPSSPLPCDIAVPSPSNSTLSMLSYFHSDEKI